MEFQSKEIIRVPVCLDNNQQVIAMFDLDSKHENGFGTLCRELGGLPTLNELETWLADREK